MGIGAPYFVARYGAGYQGRPEAPGLRVRHRLPALRRPDEPAAGARRLGHRPRPEGRRLSHLVLMTTYAALVGLFFALLWRRGREGAGEALPADLPRHDDRRHPPRVADVSLPDRARRSDPMSSGDLLVVAGEASGDQHGARMLRELKRLRPGLQSRSASARISCAAEGVDLVADSREISVVGISEALAILPRAKEIQDLLVAACERRRPDVAVLIDFPGVQSAPRPQAQVARDSSRLLHQSAGLGLAQGARARPSPSWSTGCSCCSLSRPISTAGTACRSATSAIRWSMR